MLEKLQFRDGGLSPVCIVIRAKTVGILFIDVLKLAADD